jgi:hypothetical protein
MELAFIEDNLGKIMVLVGVLLLVGAVLWFSKLLGSMLSAVSLFSGIVLVFFGLGLQLGFFSGDLRNLGGVGTVLISVSVVCIALSIAAAQFSEITKVVAIPEVFRGGMFGWWYVPATRPMYAWFSGIMFYASLTAFVSGIVFRIFHTRF